MNITPVQGRGLRVSAEKARKRAFSGTSSSSLRDCLRAHCPHLIDGDLAARDLGRIRKTVSSFSSRSHSATTRVDSSAWAEVSKKLTELMTPLSASMRK
jgi:hypothetical protein